MYKTNQGDTWDLISWKFYKTEYRIKELMKANPQYMDIVIFPAGVELTIPEIKKSANSDAGLPPWKRGVS